MKITISDQDEGADSRRISEALKNDVEAEFGAADRRPLLITAQTSNGLAGGLKGFSHWRWLYISQLWVDSASRGSGLGAQLLEACVQEARARGCAGVYVDTFSPRAKAFYEKNGFGEFGELAGMPVGHARYFLSRKV